MSRALCRNGWCGITRRQFLWLLVIGATALSCIATTASAGTIRDDVSDPNYTALAAQPEYASVGKLTWNSGGNSWIGSGTLVSSRWVLTAGHNLIDPFPTNTTFTLGGTAYPVTLRLAHPDYTFLGIDIGLARLASPAPVIGISPATRYAGTTETGIEVTLVGYGNTGNGVTGSAPLTSGTKRAGNNTFDRISSSYFLEADFDNPHSAADNSIATGSPIPLPLEYLGAGGDSGGGWFVGTGANARLVGVHAYGKSVDGSSNDDYGDISGAVRVSLFNDWIDDTIAPRWNNAAGGSINSASNWSFLPDSTDILYFSSVTGSYTATFAGSDVYNKILVRRGNVTLNLGAATQTVNSQMLNGSVVVGRDSGDSATLNLTNGTLSAVDAFIGRSSLATGTVVLSGASTQWNLSNSLYIGGSNMASGGTGTVTVNSGTSISVNGTLKLWNSSSTLNLNGTSMSATNLEFPNGKIVGTGVATLNIDSNISFTGTGMPMLDGAVLSNNGTATFSGSSVALRGRNGAGFHNLAGKLTELKGTTSNNFVNDGVGSAPYISNSGTFRKGVGSGSTTIGWGFFNGGTVDVQTGTLNLAGGGNQTGSFSVASGATLSFSGGTHNLNAGTSFTGVGNLRFSGGTVNAIGSALNASLPTTLSSGSLTITGDNSFDNLTWTGGTLSGVGTTTIPVGGTLNAAPRVILNSRILENYGTVNFSGAPTSASSEWYLNGSTINNHGTFNTSGNYGYFYWQTDAQNAFNNSGVLNKAGGNLNIGIPFSNSGTVNVNAGTMILYGHGAKTHSGAFNIASGAALQFGGNGTHNLITGANLTGAGTLIFGDGPYTPTVVVDSSMLNTSGPIILGGDFSNGTLSIIGDNAFTNLIWKNGTLTGSPNGTTTIVSGGLVSLSANYVHTDFLVSRKLVNQGTINWIGGQNFYGNGATINNEGIIDHQSNYYTALLSKVNPCTFNNSGLFKKSGTEVLSISWPFNNYGTLEVANGTLSFTGEYNQTQSAGRILLNNGVMSKSGTLTIGAGSIEGNGTIAATNVQNNGTIMPGMSAGSLTFNSNLTLQSASQLIFELGGTGQGTTYDYIDVNGSFIADGMLKLSFINGFRSSVLTTDMFTLLTANSTITGAFDNIVNGMRMVTTDGLGSFLVNYGVGGGASNLVLSNFLPAQPGDFDGDLDVDGADFVAWQTHFPTATGATLAGGDADGDGDVDGADFVVWQTNFPHTPGPAVAPVPEPSAVLLGCLAGWAMLVRAGAMQRFLRM